MKKLLRKVIERRSDESGFSLLELVVAIGILLVLTVGGLIGYSAITKNAKEAAVETAASDVMTAAMVNDSDVSDETTVEGAGQSWMDAAKDRTTIIVESKKVGSCIVVTAKHENGYEIERMAGENCSDSTNDGGGVVSPGDGNEDGDNNGSGGDGSGDENGTPTEEDEPYVPTKGKVSGFFGGYMNVDQSFEGKKYIYSYIIDGTEVCRNDDVFEDDGARGYDANIGCGYSTEMTNIDPTKLTLRVKTDGYTYEKSDFTSRDMWVAYEEMGDEEMGYWYDLNADFEEATIDFSSFTRVS